MTIRAQLASLILLASALFAPTPGSAQASPADLNKSVDMLIGDHVKVQQILTDLQRSVASHNAAGVAALIHYPIKVNPGSRPITIKNPKEFIKDYDRIITLDITEAILKQKYDALFVNSQGAMLGEGEVWITSFCLDKGCAKSDIKIGTIQSVANLTNK
jgi:alpha-beta hydrolase superfamily lysophospholipase